MSDMRLRHLTYSWHGDGPPPSDGDALVSVNGTAVYVIVEARLVRTREPLPYPKLALDCLRVAPSEIPDDALVFDLVWDSRSRAA